MGYLHIQNLYANQNVLLFKEVYCMEKIHGTSCHISLKPEQEQLHFFAGGCSHIEFIKLFNQEILYPLMKKLVSSTNTEVTIFGEGYGGKMQGMKKVYGDKLKFIAFDVKIGESWIDVPNAEQIVTKFGLEFVHYVKTATELTELDAQRDADSVQAVRNGMGPGQPREGIVIRPVIEVRKNNDERIMAKHKSDKYKETLTKREVGKDLVVLEEASAIANEWATEMRFSHVIDKLPEAIDMSFTRKVMDAMIEDIFREAENEIVKSKEVATAISKKTSGKIIGSVVVDARTGKM